jgi:hypothetical protein
MEKGIFLEDRDRDEMLAKMNLYRVNNDHDDKYFYVISPEIFYVYSGFGTYRAEIVFYTKRVLRKFWFKHHIGWPEEFDLPMDEFNDVLFEPKRK